MKIQFVHIIYIAVSLLLIQTRSLKADNGSSKEVPELTASLPLESSPIVSAVLLECPKPLKEKSDQKKQSPSCEEQLMVNIRVNPTFHIEQMDKFLILDEVYDPHKRTKAKILSPYLIEISRGEPVMMYPLEFSKSMKCENCESNSKKPYNNEKETTKEPCNSPYDDKDKLGNKPQKDSMARIVSKLAEVFAPATKIGGKQESTENAPNSCPNSYKNVEPKSKTESMETSSPESYQQTNVVPPMEPVDNSFKGSQKCAGNMGSALQDRRGDQAVVGIDDRLMKRLQSQKLAQLGFIKANRNRGTYKRGIYNPVANKYFEQEDTLIYPENVDANTEEEDPTEELITFTKNIGNQENKEWYTPHNDNEMQDYGSKNSDFAPLLRKTRRRFRFRHRNRRPGFKTKLYNNLKQLSNNVYTNTNVGNNNEANNKLNNLENCQCDKDYSFQAQDSEEDMDGNNGYNENSNINEQNEYREPSAEAKASVNSGSSFAANRNNNWGSKGMHENDQDINKLMQLLIEVPNSKQNSNRGIEGITKLWIQRNQNAPNLNKNTKAREYIGGDSDVDFDYGEEKNEAKLRQMLQNIKQYGQKMRPLLNNGFKQNNRLSYSGNKDSNSFNQNENNHNDQNFASSRKFNPQLFGQHNNEQASRLNKNHNKIVQWKSEPNNYYNEDSQWKNEPNKAYNEAGQWKFRPNNHYNEANRWRFEPTNHYKEPTRWKSEPNNPNSRNHVKEAFPIMDKSNRMDDEERLPMHIFDFDDNFDVEPISQEKTSADDKAKLNYQKALLDFENTKSEGIQKGLTNYFDSHSQFYNTPGYTMLSTALNGGQDISKSSKHLGYISDPPLDAVDPLDTLDAMYTEKTPNHFSSLSNKKYYTNVLQSPRSSAKDLINREPAKYLPPILPYENVIDDPYLSISDKLRVLEAVDPPNEKSERKLNQLTQEMDKVYIPHATPFPIPIPMTGGASSSSASDLLNNYKFAESGKRKRSFLLYDDLEMRETLDAGENEFNVDIPEQNVAVRDDDDASPCSSCGGKNKKTSKPEPITSTSFSSPMYEDVQPCSTCGGKNKKPPKFEVNVEVPETKCGCKGQQNIACDCNADGTEKKLRSVSDAWYAVFNMSAPLSFLTTKIRVFRKRHNVWWRIAPSITLNSLSGIFANENLSVLFSSHVDIIQLEKALRLQNHQLIIPKNNAPHELLSSNSSKKIAGKISRKLSEHPDGRVSSLFSLSKDPRKVLLTKNSDELCSQLEQYQQYKINDLEQDAQKRGTKKIDGNEGIRTIADLGYFPTSMDLLEQCPNDKQHLCLNMLDDKAPAFTIKMKIPFRENALINRNISRVKIASIIADATMKDVLQVSVQVINEGIEAQEFAIVIANCPTGCSTAAKTTVQRLLVPRLGETINFLLPLILETNQKHKKISCDVIVKTIPKATYMPEPTKATTKSLSRNRRSSRFQSEDASKSRAVATRKLNAETESRCFCIWECQCHCMQSLETHEDFNMCRKMPIEERRSAGLLMHCQMGTGETCSLDDGPDEKNSIVDTYSITSRTSLGGEIADDKSWFYDLFHNALMLILIMLLLGLLKAIIGRYCSIKIDEFGFAYVQPGRSYGDSSKLRRFLVNIFFFIVLPFVFWCKCFTPSQSDLLVASTEWQCCDSDTKESNQFKITQDQLPDSEEETFSNESVAPKSSQTSKKRRCRLRGGEDFDFDDLQLAFDEGIFDEFDDNDDDDSFVLQALVESRESLKKLLRDNSHQHINPIITEEENAKLNAANEFVESLQSTRVVYRTFDTPMPDLHNVPSGVRYSVQGYFLPSTYAAYEFVLFSSYQYRSMSANGTFTKEVRPPIMLESKFYAKLYTDSIAVLEANDLSLEPPTDAPCVNISAMEDVATSVAKLVATHSQRSSKFSEENPLDAQESLLTRDHTRLLHHMESNFQISLQPENAPLPPEHSSTSSPFSVYDMLDDESEPLLDTDNQ